MLNVACRRVNAVYWKHVQPVLSRRSAHSTSYDVEEVRSALRRPHPSNNIPDNICDKVGARLLHIEGHPLRTLKEIVAEHWGALPGSRTSADVVNFELLDDLSPIVTVKQNFDELLTPEDHVSRQPSDTYYVDDAHVLRCHTSAHQTEQMRAGRRAFLVAGDVYRRDTIDATHYPVFHQMEGVRVFTHEEVPREWSRSQKEEFVMNHLKQGLEGTVQALFGDVKMRWVDENFPFTDPSLELEVEFRGEWMEVLGCGMIAQGVLDNANLSDHVGWAFGLGLERLAMRLFDIPDIRLFWSQDERFLSQFRDGARSTQFVPYSKFPPCYKDVAFWIPAKFHEHDFFELVRTIAGDLVEDIHCVDIFTHPKTNRTSHCYRINYRSMDRSLTNQEVDAIQQDLRDQLPTKLGIELR